MVIHRWFESNIQYTLWLFNIAMENGPFIDDFPIETSIYEGFSMAMLNKPDGIISLHIQNEDMLGNVQSRGLVVFLCLTLWKLLLFVAVKRGYDTYHAQPWWCFAARCFRSYVYASVFIQILIHKSTPHSSPPMEELMQYAPPFPYQSPSNDPDPRLKVWALLVVTPELCRDLAPSERLFCDPLGILKLRPVEAPRLETSSVDAILCDLPFGKQCPP